MKKFLGKNFLLESETAEKLYHEFAKEMPIFDYHNHLSAKEMYEDIQFENISKLWLGGDHYKWRAMRTNGIDEEYITGDKPDYEKFLAYAKTMPYALGNPLYHWTHLELQRFFDIKETLSEKTAEAIYAKCNEKLATKEFSVRNLIRRSNVYGLCTTDDPKDDLMYHKLLKEDDFEVKVLPTFRPDNLIHLEKPAFLPYIDSLKALDYSVENLEDVLKFLEARLDYFHEVGCRLSDHGLDTVMYAEADFEEVDAIYKKAISGWTIEPLELAKYKGYLMTFLGKEYNKRGWVQQYHIGPMRNNSARMFEKLGADTGFDSINDGNVSVPLSRLMDSMDKTSELPKTILYCLNPADNATLVTMCGNFQGGSVGKIQFGSGWWFLDTKSGMIKQMEDLAAMGLLSRFIGMLTDSRSFTSFTRHEYFRRIMCNEIAKLVENGEYPADFEKLEEIVKGICFNNAKSYIVLD